MAVEPNKGELKSFVEGAFKHAPADTYVSFRAFDADGPWGRWKTVKLNGAGFDQLVDVAYEFALECAAVKGVVFCPPVATFKERGNAKGDNLAAGLVLTVECDEAPNAARAVLEKILGPPTLVVRSGGVWVNTETGDKEDKLHLHWRLHRPTLTEQEHALLYEARRIATAMVGGDVSAINSVHPLRWPGSLHTKAKARLCITIKETDVEIELQDALERLLQAAAAAGIKTGLVSRTASPVDLRGPIEGVRSALEVLPNDKENWAWWSYVGGMIVNVTGGSEEGFEAFDSWSAKIGDVYDPDYTRQRWEEIERSPFTFIGYRKLTLLAEEADPNWIDPDFEELAEEAFAPYCEVDRPLVDLAAPFTIAKLFVDRRYTDSDRRTLHHYRGESFRWSGSAYTALEVKAVRAELYPFLEGCDRPGAKTRVQGKDGKIAWRIGKNEPVKPGPKLVSDVVDGLQAAVHLDDAIAPPAWLDATPLPAHEIVACKNGLLHLPSLTLLPHTPAFFTRNALDYAYHRGAPPPARWLAFLDELWPGDPVAIKTLQEIFGLSPTVDTSHQKIFLLIGPKRSGKGTIARVLRRLIGDSNVAAPTLVGLGTNFGLAPLIGKQVAVISDARLGGRSDLHAITERLLAISGEDALDIDRKYLSAWTGQLQVRFVILSNELPRLPDSSGALAGRFVMLVLTESFYGREDRGLLNKLIPEMPGILNWAIAGWQRLNKRGHFRQPKSAKTAFAELEDLGSPVRVFLRECCVVVPGQRTEVSELFTAWCEWCERQGRKYPGDAQAFGRDLRAVLPRLKIVQPRVEGKQVRMYEGIGLQTSTDEDI